MNISSAQPQWGLNLQPGYCGFITREHNLIDSGIAHFERDQAGLPFIHTFVVHGPNLVIEAHAKTGVSYARLDQYFGSPNTQCYIRAPIGWTPEIGDRIVTAAEKHIGEKYDYSLILAEALAHSWWGHAINKVTGNVPDKLVSWVLCGAHEKICSGLVAISLQQIPYLVLRGCLRRPYYTINPKELGNDEMVFHELAYKLA